MLVPELIFSVPPSTLLLTAETVCPAISSVPALAFTVPESVAVPAPWSTKVPEPDLLRLVPLPVMPLARVTSLPLVLTVPALPETSLTEAVEATVPADSKRSVPPSRLTVAEPTRPVAKPTVPTVMLTVAEPSPGELPVNSVAIVLSVVASLVRVPEKPETSPVKVSVPPSVRRRVPVPESEPEKVEAVLP